MPRHERVLIDGPTGLIEVFVEPGDGAAGIALIAHPHPLFGGTADNKVVTTLAHAFREMGCITLRPNFRGVGASAGEHDDGGLETDDLMAVLEYARRRLGDLPVYLAGFSFGAFVITRVARRLRESGHPARRLVLVGAAAGHVEGARQYAGEAVPPDTVLIHGAEDDTVPLKNVLEWARSLNLPVVVVPGADHFFHGRLQIIRDIVRRALAPPGPVMPV